MIDPTITHSEKLGLTTEHAHHEEPNLESRVAYLESAVAAMQKDADVKACALPMIDPVVLALSMFPTLATTPVHTDNSKLWEKLHNINVRVAILEDHDKHAKCKCETAE